MTQTTGRPVAVVTRTLAILDVLADAGRDLGTNEIARLTGTNASSVSRVLATLADAQLVQRSAETGRYRLGLRLVQLGNAALARIDLRELAHPHLVALMEATGETATLSVPGEQAAMTVDFAQSSSSVRSVAQIGRPSVPHATAIGKVLLAYGGATVAGATSTEALQVYTEHTLADPDALAKCLAEVRERGWAQALEEREIGLHAVAVPVLDATGALVAVLGVQGPSWRFGEESVRAAVDALLEHAVTLSPISPR